MYTTQILAQEVVSIKTYMYVYTCASTHGIIYVYEYLLILINSFLFVVHWYSKWVAFFVFAKDRTSSCIMHLSILRVLMCFSWHESVNIFE